MSVRGYIMQVQPFSVNDGDGIRTTVFIAGCPLRCRWCSNPEGFLQKETAGWYRSKCIGCGACTQVCPQGIGIDLNAERSRCTGCGLCADVCPPGARTRMVSLKDADEILEQLHRHRLFYSYSGGGVTFSGGEATSQPELLEYLTERIYDFGYSMDIETCGYFDFDRVRPSLARMDLIFMDIKHMDPEEHRKYTGVSNEKILANAARLKELDADVVIRVPVIAGVNNSEDNIRQTAAFVRDNIPGARMELLPYHRLGAVKYEALGMRFGQESFSTPSREEMNRLTRLVVDEGVRTADFR